MIEIQVPKDITTYKTKIIGPLTVRQLVILVMVIALDIFLYTTFLMGKDLSMEMIMYGAAFIDLPMLAFMFEVYGLPMEKFLMQFVLCNVLAPVKRRYICSLAKEVEPSFKQDAIDRIEKKRKKMIRASKKNKDLKAYN